eukprot:Platyproteum_vivax@DN1835_c0_g1_i1.p1
MLPPESNTEHISVKFPVSLEFKDIYFSVPLPKKKEQKTILHGVSGSIEAGQFCALMGPSGCGKTSLLKILANQTSEGVKGEVLLNGHPRTKNSLKVTGFVMQQDIFLDKLTVGDTLKYGALLRLPTTMSISEKEDRAKEVLCELGLEKTVNTKIGGAYSRGVSGGELKRVNIASELLINPSMCLLDEPTTGLDSSFAYVLTESLASIATTSNRAIICSIHQPSSQIYTLINKLFLMMQGHIVYAGKASEAAAYFEHLGFPCPPLYNIADHLIDVLANDDNLSCLLDSFNHHKNLLQIPSTISIDGLLPVSSKSVVSPVSPVSRATNVNVNKVDDYIKNIKRPNWFFQVAVLVDRQLKQSAGVTFTPTRFCYFIVVGFFVGFYWFRTFTYRDEDRIRDHLGVCNFCVMFNTFVPVFGTLNSFPAEKGVIMKERFAKTYMVSAYFVARSLVDIAIMLVLPVLFFLPIYFFCGFPLTPSSYFGSMLTILLHALAAQSLGLVVSSLIHRFDLAAVTCVVIILLNQFASGFIIQKSSLPVFFRWLEHLSFISYSYSALVNINMAGYDYKCHPNATAFPQFCTTGNVIPGIEAVKLAGHRWSLGPAVGFIMSFFVLFRLLAYLALRFSKKWKLK